MIDAHQHFWDISREDCTWPTQDLAAIFKSYGLAEYQQACGESSLNASVLVQSQACDSDTDYLLDLAEKSTDVGAVVAWVDLQSPQARDRIRHLAENAKVRGVRPMLQAMDDTTWILREELDSAIVAMQESKLGFDALVQPRHLNALDEFAERYKQLQIVIDHGAKPNIAAADDGEYEEWAEGMEKLAARENVFCKLSGLVTEASDEQLAKLDGLESIEIFLPWVKHLYKSFGADKLMWGSDWPVLNLACSFQQWLSLSERLLQSCISGPNSHTEQLAIFSGTAKKFYRIDK